MPVVDKFAECSGCINKELDPFQCRTCVAGNNQETDSDDVEHIAYHELKELMRRAD